MPRRVFEIPWIYELPSNPQLTLGNIRLLSVKSIGSIAIHFPLIIAIPYCNGLCGS